MPITAVHTQNQRRITPTLFQKPLISIPHKNESSSKNTDRFVLFCDNPPVVYPLYTNTYSPTAPFRFAKNHAITPVKHNYTLWDLPRTTQGHNHQNSLFSQFRLKHRPDKTENTYAGQSVCTATDRHTADWPKRLVLALSISILRNKGGKICTREKTC